MIKKDDKYFSIKLDKTKYKDLIPIMKNSLI